MANYQKYGIKYPFSNENDEELFIDVNDDYNKWVESRVLHVLFTPKGQKIRDPEFGTYLIKYMFDQSDEITYENLVNELRRDIEKYVKEVEFDSITIKNDDNNENGRIIMVHYIIRGSGLLRTAAVRI